MAKVSPDDESILLIVLDAFGLPLYKIEDELYQHYILTCDHRRVKPMSKEQFISFLKHMETQGVFSSFRKEGKTFWKRQISFKDLDKEEYSDRG
jgi:Cdc6-like AAA superfamily ATPase